MSPTYESREIVKLTCVDFCCVMHKVHLVYGRIGKLKCVPYTFLKQR